MTISYQPSLVLAAMFYIINQMDSNSLVSRRWLGFISLILEDLIGFHGCKFKLGSILPFGVAIALINFNCMPKISWGFKAILVLCLSAKFSNFNKVG